MNSKFFAGLAIAAAFLFGGPAFGFERGGGHGGARVAASHAGSRPASHHAVAAMHRSRGYNRAVYAKRGGSRTGRGKLAITPARHSRRAGVAFGGSSYQARSRSYSSGGNSVGGNHGQYAFASHPGWSTGHEYYWHGRHYRWYDNGWFIIDPLSLYGYPYYPYGPGYGDNTDSVSVQVQQTLAHDGYYDGPIDGILGRGTSSAIADYQRDNGLPVTGSINGPLLHSMGI